MNYIFCFIALVLLSCSEQTNRILVQNTGETQGTYYHVQYLSENGESYKIQIDSLLDEIDSSVSIYKPYSIISKLNRGEKVQTDDIFNSVYLDAVDVYVNSNGYFDCTVSPLVSYWGFYKNWGQENIDIDSLKIKNILKNVGTNKTDISDGSVYLDLGVQIDFNAIAQGYSVDLIANLLENKGVQNYLIEVGGEIKAKGVNTDDKIWRVGIDKPLEEIDTEDRFQFILELDNKSLATSGNYRKFYEKDGIKYSHTINPMTGFPVQNRLLSVTVITNKCSLADAYATAFMAMGVEQTKKLLMTVNDPLDVYLVYTDKDGNWKTYISPRMQEKIIN
ncbi:MAG: thiamine biosynthesis protein ApbE [Flavobacteriales bacterium]|nr:thiamine biosynthesis protein ApbE [Flavobacteriales bacterium]